MKTVFTVYRSILTAYKAVAETSTNGVPNKWAVKTLNRVIRNAQGQLKAEMVAEMQERALIKVGINSAEPMDYTGFDWDNPENWAKSE